MKDFLIAICWLWPALVIAQVNDSTNRFPELISPANKVELLSGGFVNIAQNGQMNAAARIFRLYIGEPGKFQLPLSVYSGVSANNFSNTMEEEDLLPALINPATGVLNMSLDGSRPLLEKPGKFSSVLIQYQASFRIVSVYNSNNYSNLRFFNLITGVGLTFITGAWERGQANNLGMCWVNLRGLYSKNPYSILKELLMTPFKPDFFGYSIGFGIEISAILKARLFYFRFLNNQQIPVFTRPALELSFTYSLN